MHLVEEVHTGTGLGPAAPQPQLFALKKVCKKATPRLSVMHEHSVCVAWRQPPAGSRRQQGTGIMLPVSSASKGRGLNVVA